MATWGGAPKKIFFDGNALSGSIHSTYQLPSLQTDQIPTLGQPNAQDKNLIWLILMALRQNLKTSILLKDPVEISFERIGVAGSFS